MGKTVTPSDVTIVIPQRGRGELAIACIRSIRSVGEAAPIVVVDDGSGDGAAEQVLRADLPGVRVIELSTRGVTAAWNAGIQWAETRYVVILNNDVLANGVFLEELLNPLRAGRALVTGVEWRLEPLVPERLWSRIPDGRLLSGWCLGFRKEFWESVEGFDERYEVYYSDTDFQCRAVEGWDKESDPLWALTTAPLKHLGHQTTRGDLERHAKWRGDREVFAGKWRARNVE